MTTGIRGVPSCGLEWTPPQRCCLFRQPQQVPYHGAALGPFLLQRGEGIQHGTGVPANPEHISGHPLPPLGLGVDSERYRGHRAIPRTPHSASQPPERTAPGVARWRTGDSGSTMQGCNSSCCVLLLKKKDYSQSATDFLRGISPLSRLTTRLGPTARTLHDAEATQNAAICDCC